MVVSVGGKMDQIYCGSTKIAEHLIRKQRVDYFSYKLNTELLLLQQLS